MTTDQTPDSAPDRPPVVIAPDLDLLTTDERGGEPPYRPPADVLGEHQRPDGSLCPYFVQRPYCRKCGAGARPARQDTVGETVDANSDEGMLREAHDVIHFAMNQWNDPPMPWQWLAADLMSRLTERFPDAKDVVES